MCAAKAGCAKDCGLSEDMAVPLHGSRAIEVAPATFEPDVQALPLLSLYAGNTRLRPNRSRCTPIAGPGSLIQRAGNIACWALNHVRQLWRPDRNYAVRPCAALCFCRE